MTCGRHGPPSQEPGKGADPKTAFMQVSPGAVLFNLDWGDDLVEVVVCYAVLAGTTDGGWTTADGEMLELRVWALWFLRVARKAYAVRSVVELFLLPALWVHP